MNAAFKRPDCTRPLAYQSTVHRNSSAGYANDLAKVIANLSETGMAKLFALHLSGNHEALGVFLDSEMLHYRINRGN